MGQVIESTPDREKEFWPRLVFAVVVGLLGGLAAVALYLKVNAISLSLAGVFLTALAGWLFFLRSIVRGRSRRVLLDVLGKTVTFENFTVKKTPWSRKLAPSLTCSFDDVLAVYDTTSLSRMLLALSSLWLAWVATTQTLVVITRHGRIDVAPDMQRFEWVAAALKAAAEGKKDPTIHGKLWLFILVMALAGAIAAGALIWAGVLG